VLHVEASKAAASVPPSTLMEAPIVPPKVIEAISVSFLP
jgi:hypothetical protein